MALKTPQAKAAGKFDLLTIYCWRHLRNDGDDVMFGYRGSYSPSNIPIVFAPRNYLYGMKTQNYKNHIKVYPPHHFLLLPLLMIAIGVSVYHIFHVPESWVFFTWLTVVLVFIFWVAVILRQHYALGNQNRIVRLEMRLRYFELTGKRFGSMEQQLTFGQIAALRFAGDEELLPLMDRAIKEKLEPKEIKLAITDWQADDMRV